MKKLILLALAILLLVYMIPAHAAEIHEAAKTGDIAKIEKLIADGADINLKDQYSWTPLLWATRNGHKDIAKVLITKGADINARDDSGQAALRWAVNQGKIDIIEILLAKGANVNAKNKDGKTPVMMTDDEEIKKLLKK